MKPMLFVVSLMLCSTSASFAQTINRVSGGFRTLLFASTGGFEQDNCTVLDEECVPSSGWPSTSSSAVDAPEWADHGEICAAINNPACASTSVTLVNVSSSEKHVVWQPKIFGEYQNGEGASDALASVSLFNDLVLSLTVPSNPTRKYNVEARLIIESEEAEGLYVRTNDGATIDLTVDAALSTNSTRTEDFCGSNVTVSEWDDVSLFDAQYGGNGCHGIQEDQEWTVLGTVCPGDNFRLGFRMILSGEAPVPQFGGQVDFSTQGTNDICNGSPCSGAQPLRVVFAFRVRWDGQSMCE